MELPILFVVSALNVQNHRAAALHSPIAAPKEDFSKSPRLGQGANLDAQPPAVLLATTVAAH